MLAWVHVFQIPAVAHGGYKKASDLNKAGVTDGCELPFDAGH